MKYALPLQMQENKAKICIKKVMICL